MSEPLDSLVRGWKAHFASADRDIEWGGSAIPLELELTPGVWLVGELDAWGRTGANRELFFGEWKTANPREKKTWKQIWRMNPQSLSYGVLARAKWPEMERFTVRKAFKENVPTYDHAWYRYSDGELLHWAHELCRIAEEIELYQSDHPVAFTPWPTNFGRCFRYGQQYACPFFECACSKQQWSGAPAVVPIKDHWSYWGQRAAILEKEDAIVLSPTTVADWLDCREMYRRKYVELVPTPKNDSLVLGGEFHTELADYYKSLVKVEVANG